jgi:signal transduction histidine kinase
MGARPLASPVMGSLARRMVASNDADRKRLERSLHDGAQQRLVAATTTLGLALRRLEGGEEGAGELVREASEELQRCAEDLRGLAREIYPAVLAERGLASALGDLAHRAPGMVETEVVEERFPEPVELAVYLLVSEALRDGDDVSVMVTATGGELVVDVRGAGLEPNALAPLRDRVEALDGNIEAGGDSVRAALPIGI